MLSVCQHPQNKRAYPVLKAPTEGGAGGREFLDSHTLAKIPLKFCKEAGLNLQLTSGESLPLRQVRPSNSKHKTK
jgi:hypothetical protein